jgi:hypothetical protein
MTMKIVVKYDVQDAMSCIENAAPITERNEHLSRKLTQIQRHTTSSIEFNIGEKLELDQFYTILKDKHE